MALADRHWPRADHWLAREDPNPEVLVVGVPSSKASLSPSRADLTPLELRHRLGRFSTFHSETGIDFGDVAVRDMGNWPVSELDMTAMPDAVTELARALPQVPLSLFLGGDNAITRPLVASSSEDLSRVGVITFDAHHDVRTLDAGPTNGTPIRGLIEHHSLPGENVVQIGIHSFANSKHYRDYCDARGIRVVTMADVEYAGIAPTVAEALDRLSGCETICVDVDLDVLDRAFAPACPGARPGGMPIRQLSRGVMLCARQPKVRMIDFVEVDASADVEGITLDAMAHVLLSAVAGYAGRSGRPGT
jgi:formimidoylglutamase